MKPPPILQQHSTKSQTAVAPSSRLEALLKPAWQVSKTESASAKLCKQLAFSAKDKSWLVS